MRLLTILFTLYLAPVLLNPAQGQGFSISPSRIFFTGNPGETVSQTITFGNTSGGVLSFTTRKQDWERDSLGTKVYYDSNTKPLSNAGWITLSSNDVSVQPGENKQVIISLNIPADAKKLTSSMLFFTQVREQEAQQKSTAKIGINVLMEVGIQVYYVPRGLSPGELEFLSFDDHGLYENGKNKYRRLALKIHNKGSLNKDAFIRFELTNKETGEEIKIKPEVLAMLPDATQWVMVDLPFDLKGKFLAVALLDAGSSYDLKVAEKEIIYRP
ncbi:hypothetical protein HDF26_001940 [Pedobacter cryoconitis]|uniref:Fn3 domain-containing protein n=1 Tax=Pedobacter cryoconitis TaxID=188932 RepID=A0A7W8ZM51_9SPHI|nr:hypothetical protein [Pedobacter cryoconitis]MBB5636571.1 hypothetical protein [Pedobacter cryoconitis]MBB6271513.1 hypothetical protein [Pedobacter cryoconitis]